MGVAGVDGQYVIVDKKKAREKNREVDMQNKPKLQQSGKVCSCFDLNVRLTTVCFSWLWKLK
jgi:hypothetical protein